MKLSEVMNISNEQPKSSMKLSDVIDVSNNMSTLSPEQQLKLRKKAKTDLTAPERLKKPNIVGSALAGIASDIGTIPTHFANQLLLGLPEMVAKQYGLEFKTDANAPIVNLANRISGIGGALVSLPGKVGQIGLKTGVESAKKAPVAVKIGTKLLNLSEKVGTSAGIGAVSGAIQAPRTESPEQAYTPEEIKKRAITGAIMGGATPIVASIAGKVIGKGIEKYKNIKNIISKSKQVDVIPEKITAKTEQAENLKEKLSNIISEKKNEVSKGTLNKSALAADEAVNKITPFFRENSDFYDKYLTDIEKSLTKKGKDLLNKTDVARILEDTKREASEKLIDPQSPSMKALDTLIEKYRTTVSTDQNTGKLISTGSNVPLRELINDVKNINNTISSSVWKGGRRFSADEIPAAIAKKNIGDLINKATGDKYKDLQKKYSEVIGLMDKANKIFKPYSGEYETTATRFIKRAAEGNLLPEEAKFVQDIKTGKSGFAKGIGTLEENVADYVNKGRKRISDLENRLSSIPKSRKNIVAGLKKELTDAKNALKTVTRAKFIGGTAISAASLWGLKKLLGDAKNIILGE